MRRLAAGSVGVTLGVMALVSVGSEASADKSRSARLAAGEIFVQMADVKGYDVPEARVEAVIDAPPAKLWKVLQACADYSKTMPRVAKSEQLSLKGGVQICRVTIDAPFPVPNLTATTEATIVRGPPVWSRKWKLIEGDYKTNIGSWTVKPFAGSDGQRSHVWYRVIVDPDIAVPGFVQTFAQESSLPDMIERLREAVAVKQ